MTELKRLSKKIVLLGDPSVGKTSLVRKFVFEMFDDKYISTLGTKISKKQLVYNNLIPDCSINLTLLVWDVMGQRDFYKFHDVAFTGCKGGLIISDVTRKETIENCQYWQKSLFKSVGEIPIIILGNKIDLAEKFETEVEFFKNFTTEQKIPNFLTSAKTGENVETAFQLLGKEMIKTVYD